MVSLVPVHLVALLHFAYAIYYDLNYVHWIPSFNMEGTFVPLKGRLKFLTFWNLVLQTIYFSVAVLNDFIGTNENVATKPPLIRKLKDYLFSVLAFPTAMYVGITFWSLMAIDRELVFPKVLDEFFPSWLNHVMHTNIMIFILIELIFTCRVYPPRKSAMTGILTFFGTYLTWIHIIYYKTNAWVYPVLTFLNWPQRAGFYVVSVGLGVALFFVGEFLNSKIWGKQIAQAKKSSRKKAN